MSLSSSAMSVGSAERETLIKTLYQENSALTGQLEVAFTNINEIQSEHLKQVDDNDSLRRENEHLRNENESLRCVRSRNLTSDRLSIHIDRIHEYLEYLLRLAMNESSHCTSIHIDRTYEYLGCLLNKQSR